MEYLLDEECLELLIQNQSAMWQSSPPTERVAPFHINDLPDIMLLQIFNFLSPQDLCKTSQVCRIWNNLSDDELLWRGILKRDIHKWTMINHSLNPHALQDPNVLNFSQPNGKISSKQIYTSCNPEHKDFKKEQELKRDDIFRKSLMSIWNMMSPKKPPKIILYGSGLNSLKGGRKLLQNILGVNSKIRQPEFRVTGLVPTGNNGVGAGISIEFRGIHFTLITIYNSFKAEREASPDGFEFGRLLIRNFGDDDNNDDHLDDDDDNALSNPDSRVVRLAPCFHALFDEADAFVYVVDACKVAEEVDAASPAAAAAAAPVGGARRPWNDELAILLRRRAHSAALTQKAAPLLVLSCRNSREIAKAEVEGSTVKYASAFHVVHMFQREYLLMGRPWQVNSIDLSDMQGVEDGFQWMFNRLQ